MRPMVLERRRSAYRERFPTHFCDPCRSVLYPEDAHCPECNAAAPSAGWSELGDSEDRLLGRVLGDRYLLTRRIGTGSSARVYRATSLSIAREFAIKLMRVDAKGGVNAKRIEKEIEALSCLRNPHFSTIYEVLELYDDYVGLVMDLVEGDRLDVLVEREGPLGPIRAVNLVRQIANGISEAHAAGFVHRDLKPENIIVERMPAGDDFVRILDLGIVYVTGDPRKSNGFLGSPLYASPEQVKVGHIDSRSDLYSIGALLYFLLLGEAPFLGKTAEEVLRRHATEPVASWKLHQAIGPAGTKLVLDLLAKDPNERPMSAQIVVDRLDAMTQSLGAGLQETSEALSRETPIHGVFARANTPKHGVPSVVSRGEHQSFDVPFEGAAEVIGVAGNPKLMRVLTKDGMVFSFGIRLAHRFGPIKGATSVCGPKSHEQLIVGTSYGEVFLVAERSATLLFQEETHAPISSIACSDAGKIVFGTTSGRVYLGSIEGDWECVASGSPISAVSVINDGAIVAIARDSGVVEIRKNFADAGVTCVSTARSIALSQDGYLMASINENDIVTLHQTSSGNAIMALDPNRPLIAVSFDQGDRLMGFYRVGMGLRGVRLSGMKAG